MNTRLCGTCKAYQAGGSTRPGLNSHLTCSGTCRRISPGRFGFPAVEATQDWCLDWEKDREKLCALDSSCVLPDAHEGGCVDEEGGEIAPEALAPKKSRTKKAADPAVVEE